LAPSLRRTQPESINDAGVITGKYRNRDSHAFIGFIRSPGKVFKLAPDGTFTVLHDFSGSPDGQAPAGGVIFDGAGNLYGTTAIGGKDNMGTVFEIAPDGTETVVHSFAGYASGDGDDPAAGLIVDSSGNFYGTTAVGGQSCSWDVLVGCGTIFRIASDGSEKILHRFNGSDGADIQGPLLLDKAGNLYGTALSGGSANCTYSADNCGMIFRLSPKGVLKVLHYFHGRHQLSPMGGLVEDGTGVLYGTDYGANLEDSGGVYAMKR